MVSTSIGFNFSAGSVVKKACLVAINVLLMILGIAVAVLSLYQVKLMPESYDIITSLYNEARGVTSSSQPSLLSVSAVTGKNPSGKLGDEVTTKKKRSTDLLLSTTSVASSVAELVLSTSLLMPTEAVTISPTINYDKVEVDFTMNPQSADLSTKPTVQTHFSVNESSVKTPAPVQLISVVSMMTTQTSHVTTATVKTGEPSSSSHLASTQTTLSNFNKLLRFLEVNLNMEKTATTKTPLANDVAQQVVNGATKNRRSASTTPIYSKTSLPRDLPQYFEEIFNLVQTSLYVAIGAGLIIFLSALLGLCGGICRVPLCLKLGVCGIALVMILEMATAAFIFLSHDKVKNRNKYKDFDLIVQKLCNDANFCVNPMMLVLTGSFLCIAIIFQVGSITISCKLINDQADEYCIGDGNMCGVATEHRRFRRNWRGPMPVPPMPVPPMPMFPPNCGGFYSCGAGMMTGGMGQYPPMMPMQQFAMYPPMPPGPFCYPPNSGSRPTVNLAFVS